jgi:hypothetical protein
MFVRVGEEKTPPGSATSEQGDFVPGPPPKKNAARRNKKSTKSTISGRRTVSAPKLPTRKWHAQTRAWWKEIWASPMAGEWLPSDRHGLLRLAVLVNDYWEAEKPSARKELAGEIRLQQQAYGLSPLDRGRLQWEIEKGDVAQAKRKRRRQKEPTGDSTDPRSALTSS